MTQFTRKDVEEALDYIRNNVDRVIDGKYVSDIVSALLSDINLAYTALTAADAVWSYTDTVTNNGAKELVDKALEKCAKWRVE